MGWAGMSKILIVDDEKEVGKILGMYFNAAGYEAAVAYNGEEALEKVRTEKPDLIILDIMLPKMDGYEICKALKSAEEYKHIPVIIFSARGLELDAIMGEEVGAAIFITKPSEPSILLAEVEKLLKK